MSISLSLASLTKATVKDMIPSNQKMITVDSTASLPKALQALSDNNILSAPVVLPGTQRYLGFIDMVDIVTYVVRLNNMTDIFGENYFKQLEQEKVFEEEHAGAVADISHRNTFISIRSDARVIDALSQFAHSGTHRLAVVENGVVTNVLTQSAVVHWLYENLNASLGPLGDLTIQQLGLANKHVIMVGENDQALTAFKLMAQYRVGAVAIVEPDGGLLTNVSARDIKVIGKNVDLSKLNKSCRLLASEIRSRDIDIKSPHILCHAHNTFREVLGKLYASKVHRVWVTDESRRPIGVVTLSDVITTVLQHAK